MTHQLSIHCIIEKCGGVGKKIEWKWNVQTSTHLCTWPHCHEAIILGRVFFFLGEGAFLTSPWM